MKSEKAGQQEQYRKLMGFSQMDPVQADVF